MDEDTILCLMAAAREKKRQGKETGLLSAMARYFVNDPKKRNIVLEELTRRIFTPKEKPRLTPNKKEEKNEEVIVMSLCLLENEEGQHRADTDSTMGRKRKSKETNVVVDSSSKGRESEDKKGLTLATDAEKAHTKLDTSPKKKPRIGGGSDSIICVGTTNDSPPHCSNKGNPSKEQSHDHVNIRVTNSIAGDPDLCTNQTNAVVGKIMGPHQPKTQPRKPSHKQVTKEMDSCSKLSTVSKKPKKITARMSTKSSRPKPARICRTWPRENPQDG